MNIDDREMLELISLRGETPVLVAANDECQLWRFTDGTEVILHNAGISTDYDEGFFETRAEVILTWHHLPADAGQIVDVTYAAEWIGGGDGWLYCRSIDRSDGSRSLTRAVITGGEFAPQNGRLPDHGEWQAVLSPEEVRWVAEGMRHQANQ